MPQLKVKDLRGITSKASGLVERAIRMDLPNASNMEGSIQVAKEDNNNAKSPNKGGALVRFRAEDIQEKNGRIPKMVWAMLPVWAFAIVIPRMGAVFHC